MITSVILLIWFQIIPGFGEWEACGPSDAAAYGICSIEENSVLFSLVYHYTGSEIYRSVDMGSTWSISTIPGFPCYFLTSDCFDRVIAGGDSFVGISTDQGNSWSQHATVDGTQCFSIAADPSDSLHLLGAVTQSGRSVIESVDGGLTWETLESSPNIYGYSVAFCQEDPDVVYLAGHNSQNNHIVVQKSNNGGETWDDVTPVPVSVGINPELTIAVSEDPEKALVTVNKSIYATFNGGQTWSRRLITLHEFAYLEFIDSQGSVLAAQHLKFYSSTDYGQSWTRYPDAPISGGAFATDTEGKIHLSTFHGLYTADSPAGPWAEIDTGIHGGEFNALAESHLSPSGFPLFTGGYFLEEDQFSYTSSGFDTFIDVTHADMGTTNPDLLFTTGNSG